MYLFFDTETTGLPKNWKAPVTDLDNWPRMIQIGWLLCDSEGNRLSVGNHIIKPEGFIIPKGASDVHGISTEKAIKEGKPLRDILIEFNALIEKSSSVVAHNINFDKMILGAELLRKGIESSFENKPKICTMNSSTAYCNIPGRYGPKWPTLSELHIKLFGHDFEGAHDAFADIEATEKCFWELIKLDVIKKH